MSYATTPDGRKLHYETRGDDGPCVLLLNGMSQSTASWMSQARKLGERYRVVMYDARGQGKSPLGEGSPASKGTSTTSTHCSIISARRSSRSWGSATARGLRSATRHPGHGAWSGSS